MLGAAQLQIWAPGSDATQIALIESGVVRLIERCSGRLLTSPPTRLEWTHSVPEPATGGTSGFASGELRRLYLREQPNALAGTVTVAAGGTAVTGAGTAWLTELEGFVADKTSVEIEGQRVLVNAVTSDTALTLTSSTPHTLGATAKAIKADVIWMKVRSPGSLTWTAVDGRYVEVRNRVLETPLAIPAGDSASRVRVNFGYAEDAGEDDVMMLIGEMVKEWNDRQGGKAKVARVSTRGVTVSFTDFGQRADDYRMRAEALRLPMRYAA